MRIGAVFLALLCAVGSVFLGEVARAQSFVSLSDFHIGPPGGRGTYIRGETIDVVVRINHSGNVSYSGAMPSLSIGIDGSTVRASLVDSNRLSRALGRTCMSTTPSQHGNLCFSYTVTETDRDDDGISIGPHALDASGTTFSHDGVATYFDLFTQISNNFLSRVAFENDPRYKVSPEENTAPDFMGASVDDLTVAAGRHHAIELPEAVGGNGSAYEVGPLPAGMSYLRDLHTIAGHPRPQRAATRLVTVTVTAVDQDLDDSDSDAATLSFTVTVETAPPKVERVTVAAPAHGDTFVQGETVAVGVVFDQKVTIFAFSFGLSPVLLLEIGSRTVTAQYDEARTTAGQHNAGGRSSGSATLWFSHRISGSDSDADGIGIANDALKSRIYPIGGLRTGMRANYALDAQGRTVYADRKVAAEVVTRGARSWQGRTHPENDGGTVSVSLPPVSASARWSLAGKDAGRFAVDEITGALRFSPAPDYERPADSDRDNIYHVRLVASENDLVIRLADVVVSVQGSDEPGAVHLERTRLVEGDVINGSWILHEPDGPVQSIGVSWERSKDGTEWESTVRGELNSVIAGYRYRVRISYFHIHGARTVVSEPTEEVALAAVPAEPTVVSFASSSVDADEGDLVLVTLRADPAPPRAIVVDLSLRGEEAGRLSAEGADLEFVGDGTPARYRGGDILPGQALIPAGQSEGVVALRVVDDDLSEPGEGHALVIGEVTGLPAASLVWEREGAATVMVGASDPVHVELDGLRMLPPGQAAEYTLDVTGESAPIIRSSSTDIVATVSVTRVFAGDAAPGQSEEGERTETRLDVVPAPPGQSGNVFTHVSGGGQPGASAVVETGRMLVTIPAGSSKERFRVPVATDSEHGRLLHLRVSLAGVESDSPVDAHPLFDQVRTGLADEPDDSVNRAPRVETPPRDRIFRAGRVYPQLETSGAPYGTYRVDYDPQDKSRRVDLSAIFDDPDGDVLSYSALSSDNSVVNAVLMASGRLPRPGHALREDVLLLEPVASGTVSVTVWARDPGGRSTRASFSVRVEPLRLDLSAGTTARIEIEDLVSGTGIGSGSRTTFDRLVSGRSFFAATSDPTVARASIDGNEVTVLPLSEGDATLTVRITHGGRQTPVPEATVLLRVHETPLEFVREVADVTLALGTSGGTLSVNGEAVVAEDFAVELPRLREGGQVIASDGRTINRAGVAIRVTADPLPTGFLFDEDMLELAVDPSLLGDDAMIRSFITGASGETAVTYAAEDSLGRRTQQVFTLTVSDAASDAAAPIAVMETENMTVAANAQPVRILWDGFFRDPNGERLAHEVSSGSPALLEAVRSDWGFTLLPHGEGQAEVTLTATDPGGLSATKVLSVRVGPPAGPRLTLTANTVERPRWGQGLTQVQVGVDFVQAVGPDRSVSLSARTRRKLGGAGLSFPVSLASDSTDGQGYRIVARDEGLVNLGFNPGEELAPIPFASFVLDLDKPLTDGGTLIFGGDARGYRIVPATLTVRGAHESVDGSTVLVPPVLTLDGTGDRSAVFSWSFTPAFDYHRLLGWHLVRTDRFGEAVTSTLYETSDTTDTVVGLVNGETYTFEVLAFVRDIRGERGIDPSRQGHVYPVRSNPVRVTPHDAVNQPVTIDLGQPGMVVMAEEGGADGAAVALPISLRTNPRVGFTVTYSVGSDTDPATADAGPEDHGGSPGTVFVSRPEGILDFTTTAWIRIPDDMVSEPLERFVVTLESATSEAGNVPFRVGNSMLNLTVAIAASDPATATAAGPRNVRVGDAAVYTVRLEPEGIILSENLTVGYATSDGTAAAGTDYTSASGSVVFTPADAGPRTVTVATMDDGGDDDEPDKVFTFALTSATGGGAPPSHSTEPVSTAIADDPLPGVLRVGFSGAAAITATEGAAADVVATLNAKPGRRVTIPLGIRQPSGRNTLAGFPQDWGVDSTQLEFGPGDTSATATVMAIADRLHEPGEETVELTLLPPRAIQVDTAVATVTLADADRLSGGGPPKVHLLSDTHLVAESGDESVAMSVIVPQAAFPFAQTVSLSFGGDATRDLDYTVTGGDTLVIPAGEKFSSATVTLTPIRDGIDERANTLYSGTETVEIDPFIHPCCGMVVSAYTVTHTIAGETVVVNAAAVREDGSSYPGIDIDPLTLSIADPNHERAVIDGAEVTLTNSLGIEGEAEIEFAENGTGAVHTYDAGTGTDAVWGLRGPDANVFRIDTGGRMRFFRAPDHESPWDRDRDNIYQVEVVALDPHSLQLENGRYAYDQDILPVTVTVTDADEPGAVTIGQFPDTLTASLEDEDAPVAIQSWEWLRETSGTTVTIAGAAGRFLALGLEDQGATIHAVARYTDSTGVGKTARGSTPATINVAPSFAHVRFYPSESDVRGIAFCDKSGEICHDTSLHFVPSGSELVAPVLLMPPARGGIGELAYSVEGLGEDLTFDPETREIRGNYHSNPTVILVASDTDTGTPDARLTLTIRTAPAAGLVGAGSGAVTPRVEIVNRRPTYFRGDTITVRVIFPVEAERQSGTPQITLKIASRERVVNGPMTSPITTVDFEYRVRENDVDHDGFEIIEGSWLYRLAAIPSYGTFTHTGALPGHITDARLSRVIGSRQNRSPEVRDDVPYNSLRLIAQGSGSQRLHGSDFFRDPDGDPLHFTTETSFGSDSFVSITVAGDDIYVHGLTSGSGTLTIIASDRSEEDEYQMHFQVFAGPGGAMPMGTIDPLSLTVGLGNEGTVDVSDKFEGAESYVVEAEDPAIVVVGMEGSEVRVSPRSAGTTTVTVHGYNALGLGTSQTFTVEVTGNAPPAVATAIGDQDVNIGGSRAVGLADKFSDPEGDALFYSFESSDPGAVEAVADGPSGMLLRAHGLGDATVTVRAADEDGGSATQTFDVGVNRPPRVLVTERVTVSTYARIARELDVARYFVDPDGDALSLSVRYVNWLVSVSASGTTVTLNPLDDHDTLVSVTANDSRGGSVVLSVWMDQSPGDPAPVPLRVFPDVSIGVSETSAPVGVADRFLNPDGGTMTFEASSSDESIATVEITGGNLVVSGVEIGMTTVTVTATDGASQSAEQEFDVEVPSPPFSFRVPLANGDPGLSFGHADALVLFYSLRFGNFLRANSRLLTLVYNRLFPDQTRDEAAWIDVVLALEELDDPGVVPVSHPANVYSKDGSGLTHVDALMMFYSIRFGNFLLANPRLLNLVFNRLAEVDLTDEELADLVRGAQDLVNIL